MKKIVKTEAVILNKIDYSETSLIIHCYTKDYGKISAIAKGAKRTKSKFLSDIDLFNLIELQSYYKSDGLSIISETNVLNFFPKIKSNLNKIRLSYKIVDLYNTLFILPDPNLKLFNYLKRFFEALENDEYDNNDILFAKFLIYFVKEIGYEIQLDHCNICHEKISDDAFFDFENGLLCKKCVNLNFNYFNFNTELNILKKCINFKMPKIEQTDIELIINFFEKFLKYHISEFKGFNKIL